MAVNQTPENDITVELRQLLQQREAEIELLQKTFKEIASELDLKKAFHIIADRARELIQAETLLIPIIDKDCKHYTYHAASGKDTDNIIGTTIPLDNGICGWVWTHKKPWWRGALDELSERERNRWEQEAGSVILVPMRGKKHLLGGIAGINKIGDDEFSLRDLNMLSLFASIVPISLENAMAMQQIEEARKLNEIYLHRLEKQNNELIESSRELEYLSLYDPVTGLPNRSLFHDRLTQNITTANKQKQSIGLLLVDLDNFKHINENIGHDKGDYLLHLIAQRFLDIINYDETLSRLGGDEFVLILPGLSADETLERGKLLIHQLKQHFIIEDIEIAVDASIGAVMYPEHGKDINILLQRADLAMYNAKANKRDVCLYEEEIDTTSLEQLTLVGDLRQAIEEQQFELHYQPKTRISTNKLIGAEVLGFWIHPVRGLIPPSIFIHDLEETGLIHKYTYWVIETVLQQTSHWDKLNNSLKIAINLSTQTLMDPEFIKFLDELITSRDKGRKLIFEITENLFLSEYDRLSETLSHICHLGITLSIDDFGTGYSSLSRLKRLPVSELKIDRSFVMDMENDPDDEVIVHSTIELAHNLGLSVVAEGIESESVYNKLGEMGCDTAQGYYISKPLSVDEFSDFIKSYTA